MDIPIHADVVPYDGTVGTSTHIIVDLVSEQVTHFVVRTYDFHKQYLVPIDKIRRSDRTVILLACRKEDVYQLPVFDESHFHGYDAYDSAPPMPSPGMSASFTMYHPYRTAESGAQGDSSGSPWARLALKKGATVVATDGEVGKIDELVIDPDTHVVTHLVLRRHFLLNKWIVTIPVSEIERADMDAVFLKIDKKTVKTLPYVELKKFPWE